jgi:hypothetical protein
MGDAAVLLFVQSGVKAAMRTLDDHASLELDKNARDPYIFPQTLISTARPLPSIMTPSSCSLAPRSRAMPYPYTRCPVVNLARPLSNAFEYR